MLGQLAHERAGTVGDNMQRTVLAVLLGNLDFARQDEDQPDPGLT
jgi:hypothetical protein